MAGTSTLHWEHWSGFAAQGLVRLHRAIAQGHVVHPDAAAASHAVLAKGFQPGSRGGPGCRTWSLTPWLQR